MVKKIAVIGGGIAGLTAAYLLSRRYDVTLFERSDRLGGNAFTLTTPSGDAVDIAAAVFGRSSYRNVFKLFRELNVDTVRAFRMNPFDPSGPGMSYYDLDTKQGLFFTPRLKGLIAQRCAVLRPGQFASVSRLMLGLRRAHSLLRRGDLAGLTVDEALRRIPALRGEAKLLFLGCLCLISSMHCDAVLDAPAGFFIEKLNIYHDLVPPTPRTLLAMRLTKNGTKSYVAALSDRYRERIVLHANIETVGRRKDAVLLRMEDGRELPFDAAVFACNADQALAMLQDPTEAEKRLLGAWRYTEGRVVVHTDHSRFPDRELIKGYTLLYRRTERYIETSVSGSLWALPGVSRTSNLISTQHPNFPIAKDRTVFEKVFRTPLFDHGSCAAIPMLPSLNGARNTYYCGSHFGFGLHEDAVTSAVAVARALQVDF